MEADGVARRRRGYRNIVILGVPPVVLFAILGFGASRILLFLTQPYLPTPYGRMYQPFNQRGIYLARVRYRLHKLAKGRRHIALWTPSDRRKYIRSFRLFWLLLCGKIDTAALHQHFPKKLYPVPGPRRR